MTLQPRFVSRPSSVRASGRRGGGSELTGALLDPAASVRHAARFYLREGEIPAAIDFASHYRERLSGGTSRLTAAIAGLAETGTRDDARLVDAMLEHSSARVVRGALTAQARLDPDGTRERRLVALTIVGLESLGTRWAA